MILPKKLAVPEKERYEIRITPEFLKTSPLVQKYYYLQCRESDGKIVPADGTRQIRAAYMGTLSLFSAGGTEYSYTTEDKLFISPGTTFFSGFRGTPTCVYSYFLADGTQRTVCLTESAVYKLDVERANALTGSFGGTCAVFHNERLFIADGVHLHYSSSRDPDRLDGEDAGTISLSGMGGNILGVFSMKRMLFVVCENAIYRIRADASDLNFKVDPLVHSTGFIKAGSVQCTGKDIVFYADKGVIVFNGASERIAFAPDSAVTFRETTQSCVSAGKYYALTTHASYGNTIMVFDPDTGERYFVCTNAVFLAASGDHVAYIVSNRLMYMTPLGFPTGTYECKVEIHMNFAADGGAPVWLDSVESDATRGSFTLEVTTKDREEMFYFPLNKRRYFPRSVCCKEAVIGICSAASKTEYRAVILGVRRARK